MSLSFDIYSLCIGSVLFIREKKKEKYDHCLMSDDQA